MDDYRRDILIEDEQVSVIGKSLDMEADKVIEAGRKFSILGLWDMHVHTVFEGRPPMVSPMFIANEVTGIRDLGSPLPLERTNRIRRGHDQERETRRFEFT